MDIFTVLQEYQRGINKFAKMELYNLMCADIPAVFICEMGCVAQKLGLRSKLGIHWITHRSVTLTLGKTNTISIEGHIHRNRLPWASHVIRLDELLYDTRPQYKSGKRFKGCLKQTLVVYHIEIFEWLNLFLIEINGGVQFIRRTILPRTCNELNKCQVCF